MHFLSGWSDFVGWILGVESGKYLPDDCFVWFAFVVLDDGC
jgi:hypothetical protein